jgi:hypothetical protein
MKLETMQEDIDTGDITSVTQCVMGRALQRAFPDVKTLIGRATMRIGVVWYSVPEKIQKYILDWSRDRRSVAPAIFEFEPQVISETV